MSLVASVVLLVFFTVVAVLFGSEFLLAWRKKRRHRCRDCSELIEPDNDQQPWVCPHIAGLIDLDGPPWMRCRWYRRKP